MKLIRESDISISMTDSRSAGRRGPQFQVPAASFEQLVGLQLRYHAQYGRGACHPCGKIFFASSSETDPAMMTSSPRFQLTGVATLCVAESCNESMTRSTSSKFRPVVIG